MKFMSSQYRDFSAIDAASLAVSVSVDGRTMKMTSITWDAVSHPADEAARKMSPVARAQLNFMKFSDDISSTAGLERWTKCSPACMMYLFHHGNPKNFVDPNGDSVLLYAIERKEPEVIGGIPIPPQALIEAGADVNIANREGTTPLMAAAKKGDVDLVRVLLAHGVAPEAKDKRGLTAINYASAAELRAVLSGKIALPQN